MKRISDKLVELFNYRIKAELESAYLYEVMANCLAMRGFVNAAKVWRKDAEGEREHAQWAMDYLILMDVKPEVPLIAKQEPQDFKGLKDIIDRTTEHEYLVTKQCNDLAWAAFQEKDMLTYNFVARKYLAEQEEELNKVLEYQRYINTMGDTADTWMQMESNFTSKV